MMDADQLIIAIDIDGENCLTLAEVWPDGDAPENPTAADVMAVIEKCGGVRRVLHDWLLNYGIKVTVTRPNPAWSDQPALIPELAPERWIVSQAVT